MALVVFDLDGTLVDSVDGIAYSVNRVLRAMGEMTVIPRNLIQRPY